MRSIVFSPTEPVMFYVSLSHGRRLHSASMPYLDDSRSPKKNASISVLAIADVRLFVGLDNDATMARIMFAT